jgi:hypothetical protein
LELVYMTLLTADPSGPASGHSIKVFQERPIDNLQGDVDLGDLPVSMPDPADLAPAPPVGSIR